MTRAPLRDEHSGTMPPGPPWPAAVQTLLWALAPVAFGQFCLRRYGPLFTARIVGFGPVVHVCAPDTVRRVLRTEADRFDAAGANDAIGFIVGRHSLLLSTGATHTARRKVLKGPLHGANVAHYVALMESIVAREVRGWRVGSTVRLLDCFQRITLEVMMRAVFGITDSSRLDRLRVLVPRLLDINPLVLLVPAARRRFGGHGPWSRLQALITEVDGIIRAELAERRASPRPGPDVVSALLAGDQPVTDAEIRDHLVTLLAVGQETTATQLAWFFERVLRCPDALGAVTEATHRGDRVVLDAAVHEAVRVRPTTLDVGRVAVRPWHADGYTVPAGTLFAVSIGLLHRSPRVHPEPDRYDLDRRPVPGPDFLPFGAGAHHCLGASLALVEMRTVVAAVLRSVRLAPDRRTAERVRLKGPMLLPHRGAAARVVANHLLDGGG
ncbi:cytochrome P450 [Alloactinosynnema sp. L-07]|uniref:cytochrome P450 n=1 Tax=Alloactinosynnema sp. L-07 TaxID=1653480 RepID=UPI0006B5428C|nr:cytochrome P450 [Alloactinosynnema sp. L-07]